MSSLSSAVAFPRRIVVKTAVAVVDDSAVVHFGVHVSSAKGSFEDPRHGPSLRKPKHRGPSREPLGSLGHPRSGPSWLPVLRLTSAPCFSGFTGRWSFPPFREVISRVPNLDPGSSALSAFGAATVPHTFPKVASGGSIFQLGDHLKVFNFANQCLTKFSTQCSMCQTTLNSRVKRD